MTRATVAVFALLVILGRPSRAEDTLKPGDVISGPLRLVKTRHPNGMPINAYQIVADHPKKFAADDDFCDADKPPQTFHLAVIGDDSKEKWARLKQLVGHKVAVVGEVFFCSETAWHIGDAVVTKWRFTEPDRR